LRRLDQRLEDVAEPFAVAAARCSSQSDDARVRIDVEELLIGLRARVVRLVDNQIRRRRHRHALRSDAARVQRLDRRDLDLGKGPELVLEPGEHEAGIETIGDQLVAGLRDDFAPVRDHENPVTVVDDAVDDRCAHDGLAGARRSDQEQLSLPLFDLLLDLIDDRALERMEGDHPAPFPATSLKSPRPTTSTLRYSLIVRVPTRIRLSRKALAIGSGLCSTRASSVLAPFNPVVMITNTSFP